MIKFTNDDAKRISFMIDTIGRFFEEKQQISPDTELKEVYNDDDVYSHPEQFYNFVLRDYSCYIRHSKKGYYIECYGFSYSFKNTQIVIDKCGYVNRSLSINIFDNLSDCINEYKKVCSTFFQFVQLDFNFG